MKCRILGGKLSDCMDEHYKNLKKSMGKHIKTKICHRMSCDKNVMVYNGKAGGRN